MAEFVNWDSEKIKEAIMKEHVGHLEAVGDLIAKKARRNLQKQIGQGATTGISHGVFKKGRYAGQKWTERAPGSLLKTIRAVMKKGTNDVWIIAGNKKVYYARIFEFYRPFMRPALNSSKAAAKRILGAK